MVDDVQLAGTSIVSDGIANIPLAAQGTYGVVKIIQADGVEIASDGGLTIRRAVQ